MSYITDSLLAEELRRLHGENPPEILIQDIREVVRFRAWIGDRIVDFRIPEEVLHNSPLAYVSDMYLRPLLAKPPKPEH